MNDLFAARLTRLMHSQFGESFLQVIQMRHLSGEGKMLRIGFDHGRLFLTADFLARDAIEVRKSLPSVRTTPIKDHRFEPVDDLVASLDLHAASAVAP